MSRQRWLVYFHHHSARRCSPEGCIQGSTKAFASVVEDAIARWTLLTLGMVNRSEAAAFACCAKHSDAVVMCARTGRGIFPQKTMIPWFCNGTDGARGHYDLQDSLWLRHLATHKKPSLHVQSDVHATQLQSTIVFPSQFLSARFVTKEKPEEWIG